MKVQSIKFKVPMIITSLIIVLFAINGIITFTKFNKKIIDETYRQAEVHLESTINDVEGYLKEKMKIPWMMAQDQNIVEFMRDTEYRYYYVSPPSLTSENEQSGFNELPQNIQDLAKKIPEASNNMSRDPELMEKYKRIVQTIENITSNDDSVILTYIGVEKTQEFYSDPDLWSGNKLFYLRNRGWYLSAIESPDTILTAPYIDGVTGQLVVSAVTSVFENNKILGATAIDLSIQTIQELISTLVFDVDSFSFMTDQEGLIIAHASSLSYHPGEHAGGT